MRIELDDTPQALSVTFSQTLLRMLVGGVALWHGTQKWLHPAATQAQLSQLAVPDVELITLVVLSLEVAAGVALVLGRFTRTAAFVMLCDALLAGAWLYATHGVSVVDSMALEAPVLLSGLCVFFVA